MRRKYLLWRLAGLERGQANRLSRLAERRRRARAEAEATLALIARVKEPSRERLTAREQALVRRKRETETAVREGLKSSPLTRLLRRAPCEDIPAHISRLIDSDYRRAHRRLERRKERLTAGEERLNARAAQAAAIELGRIDLRIARTAARGEARTQRLHALVMRLEDGESILLEALP